LCLIDLDFEFFFIKIRVPLQYPRKSAP
jgi:hypothetical protein